MDQSVFDKYQPVIGLEVHVQLLTRTKIFANDDTSYGANPNTQISVITLGHPGTLPKLNEKVIEYAIRLGLACKSDISRYNIFDRKNYFYPDLPKGYQITQDKTPIAVGGSVHIKTEKISRSIVLNRIHMEEDAGKSIHLEGENDTLVDLNRAGVPLLEVVTEPDLRSSEEAYAFLTEMRKLVRYLDICDGNMEQGSMRCDANVSIMPKGATELGKKVEIKNMNSIRNVKVAIDHEIERQIQEVETGNAIVSETRTFDANSGTTSGMRTKEELNDYRYFPEPDLSPAIVSEERIQEIKSQMPPLPWELARKFVNEYQLSEYDAGVLTDSKEIALYFEEVCRFTKNYKTASNWLNGPIKSYLNHSNNVINELPLTPKSLAALIQLVDQKKVSHSAATQSILPEMIENDQLSALDAAEKLNLLQDSNEGNLKSLIEEVLDEFPDKVEAYKNGKKGLIGMFMGQLMKRSSGKADPQMATKIFKELLD